MALTSPVRTIHEIDPAEAIWKEVGDLEGVEIIAQNVLVAVYERREGKTSGGLIVPSKVFDEDQYQSKVGLVLKVGPRAFMDEGSVQFHGYRVEPGQWVVYKPSNALAMQIGARKCHLIADVFVSKMRIAHPDLVY